MIKSVIIIISALVLVNGISAQPDTERKLDSFRKIIIGDKIIVRLVKSDHESAMIKVQGIDPEAVRTQVFDETLSLSIYGEPFTRKKVMVTLNYVDLSMISVNNGAEVTTSSLFKADTLRVDLKSGGMLYLDADIGCLISRIIEGSLMSAEGYATNQEVTVASTGTLSAFDLESDKITVKVTTGGKAKINVEEELDAEASSKGFISYKGNPAKIKRIANSGGSIVVYEP
jgi:hypothetical protein